MSDKLDFEQRQEGNWLVESVANDPEAAAFELVSLRASAASDAALIARYKAALEGLTPGGSEFVNDPEACAKHVSERDRVRHEQIVRLKKESNSDAALIERLTEVLGALLHCDYKKCPDVHCIDSRKEARAALDVAEGRKGLCQNGDGNPVLRALLCAECIKHAQDTGAFL